MKKLIALLLAGCMMTTMVVGCGSKEEAAEVPAATEETAEAQSDLAYVKEKGTLVVGITDFAPMDYKNEGPIYGIGSNVFKLAGSVILYGVVSAWIFGMIRYLIGVIS